MQGVAKSAGSLPVGSRAAASSRQEIDDIIQKAIQAGGKPWKPALAQGSMYGGSFQDPDGHVWELMLVPQPA